MHSPIFNSYFIYFLFPLLSSSPHQYITVVSQQRSYIKRTRQRNLAHLWPICTSSSLLLSFSVGLWNCQSAVNKADFIPAIVSQTATFWAWLRPGFVQKTQQPLLRSPITSPSLTPPVRLGRVEVLDFSFLTIGNTQYSLKSHAITVTAPVKLQVVVMYRPPGQLGTFLEELDGLLSSFPEDGSPLIFFGDINVHLDRPSSANYHSLLA